MNFETIILEKKDHIATITLNRPEALNAITMQMFDEVKSALQDINEDDDIRVMVLTGAGRSFSTSIDMKEGNARVGERLFADKSIEEMRQIMRHRPQQVILGIRNLEKPTIAMVNGLAIGDSFDWVLACDIRVGSERARFMNGFTITGLFPNTGSTWFFPRMMPLSRAFELLYTGEWMEAEEAHKWGILNHLVPEDKLKEETMALAQKIAQGPPASIRMIKLHAYRGLEVGLSIAMELAADGEALMMSTDDHIEGVSAMLEKRPPKFTGK